MIMTAMIEITAFEAHQRGGQGRQAQQHHHGHGGDVDRDDLEREQEDGQDQHRHHPGDLDRGNLACQPDCEHGQCGASDLRDANPSQESTHAKILLQSRLAASGQAARTQARPHRGGGITPLCY
jgi:hypothetical protein